MAAGTRAPLLSPLPSRTCVSGFFILFFIFVKAVVTVAVSYLYARFFCFNFSVSFKASIVRRYTRTAVCVCVCVCVRTALDIYIYMYICIHMHTYTQMYIYIQRDRQTDRQHLSPLPPLYLFFQTSRNKTYLSFRTYTYKYPGTKQVLRKNSLVFF